MTPSVLERLRPAPERPDPAWAAQTLASILRTATPTTLDSSATGQTALTLVRRPERSTAAKRRPYAGLAAAAALVVLSGTGISIHLGLVSPSATVMANPAAFPSQSPDPVATDLGPLSDGELHKLVQACASPSEGTFEPTEVHYAATTTDGSSQAPRQTAVVENHRGEYRLCTSPPVARGVANTEQSVYGPGVLGPGGDLSPTPERPMSLITTSLWHDERTGDRFTDIHLAVAFAVTSQIDRVEVRLSGAGADERWFSGTVHGGFVYIPLAVPELDAPDGTPHVAVESRGFGTDGRLVANDRQDYLNGDRDSRGDEQTFWR